jgi:hypothetical protein
MVMVGGIGLVILVLTGKSAENSSLMFCPGFFISTASFHNIFDALALHILQHSNSQEERDDYVAVLGNILPDTSPL